MKKLTLYEFKINASKIHGNRYNYDFVNYTNSLVSVKIVCPEHGIFFQIPKTHLSGSCCPKCSVKKRTKIQRYNTKIFTELAIEKHKNLYDYSNTIYFNSTEKVYIFCNLCKETFLMVPAAHLRGQGCPTCGNTKRGLRNRIGCKGFIDRLQKQYGNFLIYEKINFKKLSDIITLDCRRHGEFSIKAQYLLDNKISCPDCVSENKKNKDNRLGGYNKSNTRNNFKKCNFYLVKLKNEDETFVKIGMTIQNLKNRFPRMKSKKYDVEIIKNIEIELCRAFELEQKILYEFIERKYRPKTKFCGYTECLIDSPQIIENIMFMMACL